MFGGAEKYRNFIEEYSEDKAEKIWQKLGENGYYLEGDTAYRTVDLEDNPGLTVPFLDYELKIADRIADGLMKAIDTAVPEGAGKMLAAGMIREDVNGSHKIAALSERDYQELQEVSEEVLEP